MSVGKIKKLNLSINENNNHNVANFNEKRIISNKEAILRKFNPKIKNRKLNISPHRQTQEEKDLFKNKYINRLNYATKLNQFNKNHIVKQNKQHTQNLNYDNCKNLSYEYHSKNYPTLFIDNLKLKQINWKKRLKSEHFNFFHEQTFYKNCNTTSPSEASLTKNKDLKKDFIERTEKIKDKDLEALLNWETLCNTSENNKKLISNNNSISKINAQRSQTKILSNKIKILNNFNNNNFNISDFSDKLNKSTKESFNFSRFKKQSSNKGAKENEFNFQLETTTNYENTSANILNMNESNFVNTGSFSYIKESKHSPKIVKLELIKEFDNKVTFDYLSSNDFNNECDFQIGSDKLFDEISTKTINTNSIIEDEEEDFEL